MRMWLFLLQTNEEDGDQNEEEDELEEANMDMILLACQLQRTEQRRYLGRLPYRVSSATPFEDDLDVQASRSSVPWLTDDEFKQKYRMERTSFDNLVGLIRDHEEFNTSTGGRGRSQAPVEHQLMVFLKYIGTEGSGASASDLRHIFKIGRGTAELFCGRCRKAIGSLRNQAVKWPDEQERETIAKRMKDMFNFPNCVGIADGTLFPLATEPQTEDAPDYSGRKYAFSITTMVICDDQRMIRYYLSGWPGSVHDNRVFKKTKLYRSTDSHFRPREYILGDSAFENSWFMVSAYRCPSGSTLPREEEVFNHAMSAPRVISEHTIGILKGRFPWLRGIRQVLTEDPSSMRRILETIDCCVILHNLMIEQHDEIPDDWRDDDEFSDIDDDERAPPIDDEHELNVAVPNNACNDKRRRQLTTYLNEVHVM